MEIGRKLKSARMESKLTQEHVAKELQVSRQTISNWENEKFYPDIISVIKLSDLYHISLDDLLKGDKEMIIHLQESTDVVSSNSKLITAIAINVVLLIIFILFNGVIAKNNYLIMSTVTIGVFSTCVLFYQIIKKI